MRPLAATTKEMPRPLAAVPLLLWRPKAATFVAATNRVDVVDLVVDLVDVDLDVDLVDVDLDVDLVDVDFDVDLARDRITRQECFRLLSFEKCFKTN